MGYRLTDTNRSVLLFLAEHRVVLTTQVATLLGVSVGAADQRLRRLSERDLTRREHVFHGVPAAAWIRPKGLRSIGSPLPTPKVDKNGYRHDVGMGWLWLAARSGAFGPGASVISEREMRSSDARAKDTSPAASYGVGVGGVGANGLPRRHYADLLVRTASERTLAIELELTQKSAHRLARIIRAYAGDPRIDRVLYLVADRSIGSAVQAAARKAGMAEIIKVQLLAPGDPIEGTPMAGERGRRRSGIRQPPARARHHPVAAREPARSGREGSVEL